MAKTYTDQVYAGTLGTSLSTIATIGANTVFILKGFFISNANANERKAEIQIGQSGSTRRLLPYVKAIGSGESIVVSNLHIPLTAGQLIRARGEVTSDMDYFFWGINEVNS